MRKILAGFGAVALGVSLCVAAGTPASAATPSCNGSVARYGDIERYMTVGKVMVPAAGDSSSCIQGPSTSYKSWVKHIQHNLNMCNGANLVVDGYYGDATKAAVKAVQPSGQKDGIYGPVTYSVMKWRVEKKQDRPHGGTRTVWACVKGSALRSHA